VAVSKDGLLRTGYVTASGTARKNRCRSNGGYGLLIERRAKPRLQENHCESNSKGKAYREPGRLGLTLRRLVACLRFTLVWVLTRLVACLGFTLVWVVMPCLGLALVFYLSNAYGLLPEAGACVVAVWTGLYPVGLVVQWMDSRELLAPPKYLILIWAATSGYLIGISILVKIIARLISGS
jgi:hypothetical protein